MIVIKITVDDNRFIMLESRESNLDEIDEFFTYQDTSLCWTRGRFHKDRIRYVHFMTRKKKIPTTALLPIGFLNQLTSWLDKRPSKYKVYDKRKNDITIPSDEIIENSLSYIKLYDYQINAVKISMKEGNGLVKSPTGSGKCVTGDTEIEIEFDDEEIEL